ANISASIQISGGERVKGKKVILVDDVITTGTTINHCAKILKKAGAKEVLALSIAIV
ncbi:MAG: ComF family protein, partial [Rickettsiaceae bacterium]|nr:ComF family protein [Rickettsiaceae bacterium]